MCNEALLIVNKLYSLSFLFEGFLRTVGVSEKTGWGGGGGGMLSIGEGDRRLLGDDELLRCLEGGDGDLWCLLDLGDGDRCLWLLLFTGDGDL